jgi:hypothetical protein
MLPTPSASRFAAALLAAAAISLITVGAALAHPETEGDHPSGCIVTAEPGTVPDGGEFVVEGNFGGASIFVLPGADASPGEDAVPDATTPEGDSFSVTFTAQGPGEITVVAILPESECGDSDGVTFTSALPNTATEAPTDTVAALGQLLLIGAVVLVARKARSFVWR